MKTANKLKKTNLILWLAGLMAIANACHKEPIPEPQPAPENDTTTVVPTDTIPTDTIPTDTITQWRKIIIYSPSIVGHPPSKDTIRYWLNQPDVKYVNIKFYDRNNTYDSTFNWSGTYAQNIHRARDTLQTFLDLDSLRVNFKGTKIQVGRTDLPNHDPGQEPGGAWYDIAWFRLHDIIIKSNHEQ